MLAPILATKFYIPPARPELVNRPPHKKKKKKNQVHKINKIYPTAGFCKNKNVSELVEHHQNLVSGKVQ
jgi:hypothetical protein